MKKKFVQQIDQNQQNFDKKNQIMLEKSKVKENIKKFNKFLQSLQTTTIQYAHPILSSLATIKNLQKTVLKPQIILQLIAKTGANQKKRCWGKYDSIILVWVVQKYSLHYHKSVQNFDNDDWEYVSRIIPGKNPSQCMFKWLNILSYLTKSNKQQWTKQEGIRLMRFINQNKFHNKIRWHEVSKMLYESSPTKIYRTGKQCRQRWTCFLNPAIKKGHWSVEQDILLLQNFLDIGKKWSEIAKKIGGRTENAVKNRYKLIMQKSVPVQIFSNQELKKQFVLVILQNLKSSLQTTIISNNYLNIDPNKMIHANNPYIKKDNTFQQDNDEEMSCEQQQFVENLQKNQTQKQIKTILQQLQNVYQESNQD